MLPRCTKPQTSNTVTYFLLKICVRNGLQHSDILTSLMNILLKYCSKCLSRNCPYCAPKIFLQVDLCIYIYVLCVCVFCFHNCCLWKIHSDSSHLAQDRVNEQAIKDELLIIRFPRRLFGQLCHFPGRNSYLFSLFKLWNSVKSLFTASLWIYCVRNEDTFDYSCRIDSTPYSNFTSFNGTFCSVSGIICRPAYIILNNYILKLEKYYFNFNPVLALEMTVDTTEQDKHQGLHHKLSDMTSLQHSGNKVLMAVFTKNTCIVYL
jgi:hypothetical protein